MAEFYGDDAVVEVFGLIVDRIMKEVTPMRDDCRLEAMALLEGLKPRDGVERMMVVQMLHMHARLLALQFRAGQQDHPEVMGAYQILADRLLDQFRKHVQVYDQRRRPPRQYLALRQDNILQQFIAAMPGKRRRRRKRHGARIESEKAQACLPAGRVDPAPCGDAAHAALAALDRPAHTDRQAAQPPEPPHPRLPESRLP